MSISVVTVRDYEGVPSTRELYPRGVRYLINSGGDLEIVGDGRPGPPLGYYPSGNWMSVFVDDPVRVLVKGTEDTSVIGSSSAADVAADGVTELGGGEATPEDPGTTVGETTLSADDTSPGADESDPVDLGTDDRTTEIELEPVSVVDEPDSPIYHQVAQELAAASAASTATEPATEPATEAAEPAEPAAEAVDAGGDFHTDFDRETSAAPPAKPTKPSRGTIPAGMQPVKFGPRIIRPPKPKVTPDPTRHMMPVTFRSRPLRAGLAKPTPAPSDETRADGSDGDES